MSDCCITSTITPPFGTASAGRVNIGGSVQDEVTPKLPSFGGAVKGVKNVLCP